MPCGQILRVAIPPGVLPPRVRRVHQEAVGCDLMAAARGSEMRRPMGKTPSSRAWNRWGAHAVQTGGHGRRQVTPGRRGGAPDHPHRGGCVPDVLGHTTPRNAPLLAVVRYDALHLLGRGHVLTILDIMRTYPLCAMRRKVWLVLQRRHSSHCSAVGLVRPTTSPPACPSVLPSVSPSVHPSVFLCLSACLFAHASVCWGRIWLCVSAFFSVCVHASAGR